jgi:hypothetical protein
MVVHEMLHGMNRVGVYVDGYNLYYGARGLCRNGTLGDSRSARQAEAGHPRLADHGQKLGRRTRSERNVHRLHRPEECALAVEIRVGNTRRSPSCSTAGGSVRANTLRVLPSTASNFVPIRIAVPHLSPDHPSLFRSVGSGCRGQMAVLGSSPIMPAGDQNGPQGTEVRPEPPASRGRNIRWSAPVERLGLPLARAAQRGRPQVCARRRAQPARRARPPARRRWPAGLSGRPEGACQVTGSTWKCTNVQLPGLPGTGEHLDVVVVSASSAVSLSHLTSLPTALAQDSTQAIKG